MTKLTVLDIGRNEISDISALAGLNKISLLSASHNKISDITPLTDLFNLTGLILDNNRIDDLTPLTGLINLTEVHLANQKTETGEPALKNLTPLASLFKIKWLDLRGNGFNADTDISPLFPLTTMDKLYIMDGNNLTQEQLCMLIEHLFNTKIY